MLDRIGLTKRAVIYPSLKCQGRCPYCYYFSQLDHAPEYPLATVKDWILKARNYYGLETIEITGGEPTIYPGIDETVKYCRELGLQSCIITNGIATQKIGELIDCGVNDYLISVHGLNEIHDEMVGIKAFPHLVNTLNLLRDRNFSFRVNTVITKINYKNLMATAKFLIEYRPKMINLIPFNPHPGVEWKDKDNVSFQLPYSVMQKYLKKAIDFYAKYKIWVNVRYMPLCFMQGYEHHICNFHQSHYDPYEWCMARTLGHTWKQIVEISNKDDERVFGEKGTLERYYSYMVENTLTEGNVRLDKCRSCRYYNICDGIYFQYLRNFGDQEFIPVPGEKIIHPLYFRIKHDGWRQ